MSLKGTCVCPDVAVSLPNIEAAPSTEQQDEVERHCQDENDEHGE